MLSCLAQGYLLITVTMRPLGYTLALASPALRERHWGCEAEGTTPQPSALTGWLRSSPCPLAGERWSGLTSRPDLKPTFSSAPSTAGHGPQA